MGEISLNNIIRVSVQGVPSTRAPRNINEVALFTNEESNSSAPYLICMDPSSIVDAYGTDSLTAQMVNNIFAQSPNPISGRGYVVVIPMKQTVSATPYTFTTGEISDLTAFNAVVDGGFKATVNGTVYNVGGLNFSNVTTLAEIAQVVQDALPEVVVTVNGQALVFTSKKVGENSSVVLASPESGTDITADNLLNVSGGTTVAGANSSGETLVQAITRVQNQVRFTGVMSTAYFEDDVVKSTASFIQSLDMIYGEVWADTSAIEGIASQISSAKQTQTRCLVYTQGLRQAKLMLAAYMGRAFSTNFSGSATSQTMQLKTLANVEPDSGITQNDYTNAKKVGVDLYVSYAGDAGVFSSGGNKYFDTVYENMSLKFYIQAEMYNALKTTNTKVPQTEAGMAVLRNAVAQVFILFVRNGVIAAGKWNSSQTFGDPETFRQNIQNQGWFVYSTPIADQLQSEREQRIAPMVQGACKKAGAIHEADVMILVEE